MKTLFTSALLLLTLTSFAQDTKKDSATALDYGARIYDPRIARYISTDPKASEQNNPYKFADTTKQSKNNPKEKITGKKNKP